jgi:hypothetical protein
MTRVTLSRRRHIGGVTGVTSLNGACLNGA